MKTIPYGTQKITDSDIDAVVEVLKSPFLTQGPKIAEFEQQIAEYHGAKYGVAFSNGTAALHGSYYALGITSGDEVIVPAITFAATSNAAIYLGGKPVFVDIDLQTNCIAIDEIKPAISKNTKVITPVALAGYPVDLAAIRDIAAKQNCKVLLDASHAIGSKRNSTFGMEYVDAAVFSFHPVKHITTGEGGMVITNSEEIYEKLKLFRSHGITKDVKKMSKSDGSWYYEMIDLGYNYRMTEIQAALGISQFSRVEENLAARNIIAKRYDESLGKCSQFILPPNVGFELIDNRDRAGNIHSYHLYTLRCSDSLDRKRLYEYLRSKGIMAQIHYIPVPDLPYYGKNFGYKKWDFPNAEEYYSREISIPMYHSLSEKDQQFVIDTLLSFK